MLIKISFESIPNANKLALLVKAQKGSDASDFERLLFKSAMQGANWAITDMTEKERDWGRDRER